MAQTAEASHLGSNAWLPWRSRRPATAATGPPGCSPWRPSPALASSSVRSEWPVLWGRSAHQPLSGKSQPIIGFARREFSLASFVNVRGYLDSCVGVVDVVFEVWIVDKLQLDVRGVFHLSFSIHGILELQHKLSAPHSDTTGPWVGGSRYSPLPLPSFVLFLLVARVASGDNIYIYFRILLWFYSVLLLITTRWVWYLVPLSFLLCCGELTSSENCKHFSLLHQHTDVSKRGRRKWFISILFVFFCTWPSNSNFNKKYNRFLSIGSVALTHIVQFGLWVIVSHVQLLSARQK